MNRNVILAVVAVIVVVLILIAISTSRDKQTCALNQNVNSDIDIKHKRYLSKIANMPVPTEIQKHLTESTLKVCKDISVPYDYPTLQKALDHVFSSKCTCDYVKIILETQGPHKIASKRYASEKLKYLAIESKSYTENMGMYYGHLTGGYDIFGVKGQTDIGVSGFGPFSLGLSNGNTTVTVTGTQVGTPYGFGHGCLMAPGWVVGAPPGVLLGVSPNFSKLKTGDVLKWFDAATGLCSEHSIISKVGNSITVSSPFPALSQGSGFTVRPRASIIIPIDHANYLQPEFILDGELFLNGLHFDQVAEPPFVSTFWLDSEMSIDIRRCLIQTEIVISAGSRMYSLTPNVYMDCSNGVAPARLIANAAGTVFGFRQTYVGPSAGLWAYGSGNNTMCFSTWIGCDKGVFLRANSGCKLDLAYFLKCDTGVECRGASKAYQAAWFDGCGVGIKLRNSSVYDNAGFTEFPPLPDVPMIFDGQGSGVALDIQFNSQFHSKYVRFADLITHLANDGTNLLLAPLASPNDVLISDAGVGTYGPQNSGIVVSNIDSNTSDCP